MTSIKRWLRDLKEINTISDNVLVYYDELDIHKINIILIGLDGTPYQGGFYPFLITKPDGFPFNPPKVEFLGKSPHKIHPNFHQNGYVCLSILTDDNKFGWKASMTVKSLILSLQSLFTKNPLINEPAYGSIDPNNKIFNDYEKIAEYYNFKHYIDEFIKKPYPICLSEKVLEYYLINIDKYQQQLLILQNENSEFLIINSVFDGELYICYLNINLNL
jgi:ubiquitin-protein ligase